MQITINADSINAVARHVGTATGAVLTLLALFHFITADQQAALNGSVGTIVQAIAEINSAIAGIGLIIGPLIPTIAAWYAGRSAKRSSQIAAVVKNPRVAQIVLHDSADVARYGNLPKLVAPDHAQPITENLT